MKIHKNLPSDVNDFLKFRVDGCMVFESIEYRQSDKHTLIFIYIDLFIYLLFIYYLFIIYLLFIYYLFIIYSLFIYYLFTYLFV